MALVGQDWAASRIVSSVSAVRIDQVGDMLLVKLEGLWCDIDTVACADAARLVDGDYVSHFVCGVPFMIRVSPS